MYSIKEPRIKSYGWEDCPTQLFNITKYKIELLKKIGLQYSEIKWDKQISDLINSTTNLNSLFA
jgi:hypothetical protein